MTHLLNEVELALPFWRYCEIFSASEHVFLLDSAKKSGKLGMSSYLGADPYLIFKAKRIGNCPSMEAQIEQTSFKTEIGIPHPVAKKEVFQGDPIAILQQLVKQYAPKPETFKNSDLALNGGAVGYFGYESGYFIEELPDNGKDDLALPDIYLGFYDLILSYNHEQEKAYLSVVGRGESPELAAKDAQYVLATMLEKIKTFEATSNTIKPDLQRNNGNILQPIQVKGITKDKYCELIKTCLDHIQRGEVYEICLTHRLETYYDGDGWLLYKHLRAINPAPFTCYLRFPEMEVISSSPERFLKLDKNKIVECRPIKGTRPRGKSAMEDQQLIVNLQNSIKDRAENIMIVDLVRNDLGKVCEIGSVCVPDLFVVEQYATVFQLVSTVRGTLKSELDAFDLLRATFPGGSMTGAPKIEAMKIIDRLEPVKRGIYSGAIGYIDYSGCLDFNIVIRTYVLKDNTCYYNVGGAIVADSEPEAEYLETMDKAAALKKAIALANQFKS